MAELADAQDLGLVGKTRGAAAAQLGSASAASSSHGSAYNSSENRNKFCGHPQKRDRGLHPETEERFWCGLEAVQEVTERPGQLGLQVQSIFGQY